MLPSEFIKGFIRKSGVRKACLTVDIAKVFEFKLVGACP